MLQSLEQSAKDGLEEAKAFRAVLLEAKAYTDRKVLPPPSAPMDAQRVASVSEKLLFRSLRPLLNLFFVCLDVLLLAGRAGQSLSFLKKNDYD